MKPNWNFILTNPFICKMKNVLLLADHLLCSWCQRDWQLSSEESVTDLGRTLLPPFPVRGSCFVVCVCCPGSRLSLYHSADD